MPRVSEIIGKRVVSAETGDEFGSVSDALIDVARVRVVGLVVSGGRPDSEHVVPFSDIQILGADVVQSRLDAGRARADEPCDTETPAARSTGLRGMPVVTLAGHRIGHVRDLVLDERTGAFEALELAAPAFRRRAGRTILRSPAQVRIGCDAVIVPEGAVERIEEPDDREPRGDTQNASRRTGTHATR